MSREITNRIIELAEDTGSWEAIARECLSYMSEADVADMNRVAEFVADEDDEDAEHIDCTTCGAQLQRLHDGTDAYEACAECGA